MPDLSHLKARTTPVGKIHGVIEYLETLEPGEGGDLTYTLPVATVSVIGGVKQAATQADSTATDVATLVADFNSLLTKLKAAGILA